MSESSGMVAGASLQGQTAGDLLKSITHGVAVTLEVKNYTKLAMTKPVAILNAGAIKTPASAIQPGTSEVMSMHKTDHAATGSSGTVSWELDGTSNRVVVMWSAPYSFDLHTNWLGVGVIGDASVLGTNTFNEMYKDTESWFRRKEFYRDASPLVLNGQEYEVTGTMGTTHKAEIVVEVKPKEKEAANDA